jgi:signal transduction histidine kinase
MRGNGAVDDAEHFAHDGGLAGEQEAQWKGDANAAHYGDGKPVDIDLQCEEQSVNILVCDRGPGVPDEHKEAVFRPFYRLETERSERTGGSGLGLAIARQLAIKNGWTIDLMPRQGGGTVAKLELTGADFGECSGPN